MSIRQQDIELGKKGEEDVLPLLREKIDKYLCKTSQYATMDFISPKSYVEVKTRSCRHDTYSTQMIGVNKIEFALKSFRDCYLVFNFADGVFYWKVNKEDIENGDLYYAMGGRCDRGRDERKIYAYIKNHLLTSLLGASP